MKPRLLLTFSSGRSSAAMTDLIIKHYSQFYELIICFANTGWEHEESLIFAYHCTLRWKELGYEVIWVEAVINAKGIGTSHKIVNFFSASRNQQPFIEMAEKYGLPNAGYPHCTRELKENPIRSYVRSQGWPDESYLTCIGIRGDEPLRLKWGPTGGSNQIKINPLANWFPMTKQDVLDYWVDWEHDLKIEEADGNCRGCYRKSDKKLERAYELDPQVLNFAVRLEKDFGHVGDNKRNGVYVDEPRMLYRGDRSAGQIIQTFKDNHNEQQNSKCS
jgi:3'-phosphoadenosine 5'-phosphosulfate sulfotransferase (PAPS reductase)/FAD synthetase